MKKKETVAQKALRLLSTVPKSKFITSNFTDEKGKCCAVGHYQRLQNNKNDYSKVNCSDGVGFLNDGCDLRIKSKKFLAEKYNLLGPSIATVNNETTVNGYTQKTIKARVIRLLKDMVKAGY